LKSIEARRVLLEKLPFVAAAVVVALVTVSARAASAGIWRKPVSLAEFGLLDRFMQAMYVYAYYFWRPWYPVNLTPVYTTFVNFEPLSAPFVVSGLSVTVTVVAFVFLRRQWPLGLALGIFHLALLLPVLGLFEHPHYHPDRYSLIVSVFWSILLAAWLANPKTRKLSRYIIISVSILAITVLGQLSFRQTLVWNNSVTLFEHMIRTLGDDDYRSDIHWRLGSVLAQQGDTEGAIGHFQKTLQIVSNHPVALYRIALLYLFSDRHELAIQNFHRLLQIEPDHHDANYYIAIVFNQQGKFDDAIKHFNKALQTMKRIITWALPMQGKANMI
jgi:hypothetical protein